MPEYLKYMLVCLILTLLLVSAVFNGLLVYLFLRDSKRNHGTDIYIASICAADFFLIVSILPLTVIQELFGKHMSFEFTFCKLLRFFDTCLCYILLYTMIARAMDVCFYLRPTCDFFVVKVLRTHFKAVTSFIWVSGLTLASLPLLISKGQFNEEDQDVCLFQGETLFVAGIFVVNFTIFFFVCMGLYLSVVGRAFAIHKLRQTLPEQVHNTSLEKRLLRISLQTLPSAGLFTVKDYLRGVVTLGTKLLLFNFSWFAFFVDKIVFLCTEHHIHNPAMHSFIEWAPFVSSFFNPVVYGLLNPRASRKIGKLCKRCRLSWRMTKTGPVPELVATSSFSGEDTQQYTCSTAD